MHLTKAQEQCLQGEMGESLAWAMERLVRLGDERGSSRLIPVVSVHIPDWDVSLRRDRMRSLAVGGLAVRCSLNPGRPLVDGDTLPSGMMDVRSCTPYLCGHNVSRDSVVAWGGRAACAFVNSALGARSELESYDDSLAAAISGLTPERRLHKDEGRKATVTVIVDGADIDLGTLGAGISASLPGEVPHICGIRPGLGDFKKLSFAVNSRGDIPLFNVTAEQNAPDGLEAIYASDIVPEPDGRDDADLLILGCPHLSEQEVNRWARALSDRGCGIMTWFFISGLCWDKSPKTGDVLRTRGMVSIDRCPLSFKEEMNGRRVACTSPGLVGCLRSSGIDAFPVTDDEALRMMLARV